MSDQDRQDGDPSRKESSGCLPAVLRTLWMGWGNAVLFFCAVKMAEGTATIVSTGLFVVMTGALIAARYVDIAWFRGETAHGEPADLSHWRRYAIGVLLVSAALWALATTASSRGWLGSGATS